MPLAIDAQSRCETSRLQRVHRRVMYSTSLTLPLPPQALLRTCHAVHEYPPAKTVRLSAILPGMKDSPQPAEKHAQAFPALPLRRTFAMHLWRLPEQPRRQTRSRHTSPRASKAWRQEAWIYLVLPTAGPILLSICQNTGGVRYCAPPVTTHRIMLCGTVRAKNRTRSSFDWQTVAYFSCFVPIPPLPLSADRAILLRAFSRSVAPAHNW